MKKVFLSLLTFCALSASAQIETFSVYDVNHDTAITEEDVTQIVDHALKADDDSPQTVDAAALNALLQRIDSRLAKIEETMRLANRVEQKPQSEAAPAAAEYVDLGLTSGTLWATCNVGASSPEDYGYYFAWGEVEPKSSYSWEAYKWMNEGYTDWDGCSKYAYADEKTSASWYRDGAFVGDNLSELEPADDAATVNWGAEWQMPSNDQLIELRKECTWKWSNEKVGFTVKSKVNDNSIFIPAAGYCVDGGRGGEGFCGYYWTRSLTDADAYASSNYAYVTNFISSFVGGCYCDRCYGFPVRPVRK